MAISDNTRGALLMMASMAAFTMNDTCMKLLSGSVPLFQLLLLRGLGASSLTALLAWRIGALRLRIPPRDLYYIGLRVLAEIGSAYFFLTALFNMPLANVTSIMQSLPLVVTLAAALFFGEPLGWRRLTAIFVGFVGVLLIVRPGTEGFNVNSIYVLIAVVFVTLRDLATRRLSGATQSVMVTLFTSVSVTVFFGIASIWTDWAAVDGQSGLLIAGAALFVFFGYTLSVMVMRVGEISFVAPFRYTGLIWALVLGYVIFGDWPKPLTLIGATIVVGSGIFMLYRERQLRLRTAAQSRMATQRGL